MNGRDGRSREKEEDTMRLISAHELDGRTETELSALFQKVSKGLVRTERSTPARRNALGSLENISRARIARLTR